MASYHTFLWILLSLPTLVFSHYCTYRLCQSNQYCCGPNQCCVRSYYRVWDSWYFWFTVVVIVLVILSCCIFIRRRRTIQRRSNDVVVYSAHGNTVTHVPYGHEMVYNPSGNTHYYMAPVMSSHGSPAIGQGYPQAFVYPTYNCPPATFSSAPPMENKNF